MPENPLIPISKEGLDLFKRSLEVKSPNTSEFKGIFGEHILDSKFDSGLRPGMNRLDYLGEVQPISDKLANTVPRLLSKVGTEIAKTPGYLYAVGSALSPNTTLAESLNNSWINGLESFDQKVKEEFAIHKPKAVREGNLWDNLTSASFWTDEGVDGAAYLISMLAPGAALKATGMATKLAKLPGLSKLGQANIELGQATLLNTTLEAAAETKGIVDNLNKEFKAKIGKEINPITGAYWTEEDAKEAVGNAAVNTFSMNMGLLLVPNMIMNKNLLGRFNTSKTVLDDFRDPITGKLVANNPIAKKSAIKEYMSGIGEAAVSEGFVEEAGQTTIENYNSKVALNQTNKGILEGLASEYINTLSSTEGQKAVLLGAVLGSLGGTVGKYRELKQEKKDRNELSRLIKDKFEGFSTDMSGIVKTKPDGTPIINPETNEPEIDIETATNVISNIVKEHQSTNLQDLAAIQGNKVVYDYIQSSTFARYALPYVKQEGGLEVLNQHIDELSKVIESNKTVKGDNFSETEFKNDLKEYAKQLELIHNSVSETVSGLGLENLSTNTKQVEKFANKLAYAAYSETAKQLFFTKEIKKLNRELLNLQSSDAAELPQTQTEIVKLQASIDYLKDNLVKSVEAYKSIFDPTQHVGAFNDMIGDEEVIKKDVEKAVKKAEKAKPTKTEPTNVDTDYIDPTGETTDIETLVPKKTSLNMSDEERAFEQERLDTLIDDATETATLAEFNAFKNTILEHPLVTASQKAKLNEYESALKIKENVHQTINNDDELVSNYLNTNTVASSDVADNQALTNPKDLSKGRYKDLEKGIGKVANAVMMHLFNHYFENGKFKFVRKDGLPKLDNNSNINLDSLNTIQEGDTITFKTVKLDENAEKLYNKYKEESISSIKKVISEGNKYDYSKEDNYGFDDIHIGIYDNNENLIGFVQQPHAISELIDEDNIQDYIDSRNALIKQRKAITDKLNKGETVTSIVEAKGTGNMYTKLTEDGKIDPVNKVLDNIRDKDKYGSTAVFVYNNGEKLVLPKLPNPKLAEEIEESIAGLGNFGNPGQVFQLVKTPNNDNFLIPIYSEKINEVTANAIIKVLSKFDNTVNPLDVVRELNPYILSSLSKGDVIVRKENNLTEIWINGKNFKIESINGSRKNEFIKELYTKRQNIEVSNINIKSTQDSLKERGTLITNATLFNGEYFVQPYISYKPIGNVIEDAIPAKDNTIVTNEPKVTTPKTVQDKLKDLGISDTDLNNESGFSQTISTKELNLPHVKKWLKKNLPGLSIADVKAIAELKTKLNDSIGAYKDMLIYLFNGSDNKTAYHEAFHGVFRNMLSPKERFELLEEAINIFDAPTDNDLNFVQQPLNKTYNKEQLTYLYYEEKLADAFADYTDRFEEKSLTQKIKDFFNKILQMFGIISKNDNNKIDELFYRINTGNFKSKSEQAKNILNKQLSNFIETDYAHKRIVGLTATQKYERTKSLASNVLAEYNKLLNTSNNEKIDIGKIFKGIENKYTQFILESSEKNNTVIEAAKILNSFEQLKAETINYMKSFGIKVANSNIVKEEQNLENDADVEIETAASQTTKGFGEWVSIPGMKSASTRLKVFLMNIPVIENNSVKKDAFGLPIYHDFTKLYYFLERNLTDVYTLEEMIDVMDSLSINRPELSTVISMLIQPSVNMNEESLTILQNDFKSNFSKQQLSYTLVKFDTDSTTGKVVYRIMESNRQTLGREIYDQWNENLVNPAWNTIAEHKTDGEVVLYGTDKSKKLAATWEELKKQPKLDYNTINNLLLSIGIEYTPKVLNNLLQNKTFRTQVNTVIKWYSADDTSKLQVEGRKALSKLVQYEVNGMLNTYTQSFNNVEDKSIYTIQLPSFASKVLSKFNSEDYTKFENILNEYKKDPLYNYSNLLIDFLNDNTYRTEGFKLNYLDGLKDDKGNSDGAKFTNMSPKDFMAMQFALFENINANKNRVTSTPTHKYVYITPSDKTMSMIFDAKKYGVNIKDDLIIGNSEILGKFYNVVLQEASRIKQQLDVKNKVLAGELDVENLLEHYHYNKSSKPKRKEDGSWDLESIKWDGQAYKFNHFSPNFNKTFYDAVVGALTRNTELTVEEQLEGLKPMILSELLEEINDEYNKTLDETVEKGIIKKVDAKYENIALDNKNTDEDIRKFIAEFSTNTWLFNIEASNLLNGDIAMYKPGDIQKRTYQSGSMTIMGNTAIKPKIRTRVVKDYETKSEFTNDPAYEKINVTDAQVYISPEFFKSIHLMRGTWTDSLQLAYDIAEGNIKPTVDQLEQANQQLAGIKPFYFGNRFDDDLGIMRYEQVKCAMLPLFKSYIANNPLLAEKRQEMDNVGIDMIAHESAFKAAIGYRTDINNGEDYVTIDLDTNNFGIQVDNPNHTYEEANSSMRQLKMLLLGAIDTNKVYKGTSGRELQELITNIEAINTIEDLEKLKSLINHPTDHTFKNFIKEQLTKRNATENVEQALNIINGEFEYTPDLGPTSKPFENLISSIFTDRIIKQEFKGGSVVQATSLGLKYSSLKEQQAAIEKDPVLYKMQSDLKWHRKDKNGDTEYAEAIMPAWASEFFDDNGYPKDNVPVELREILTYRIPTEGAHSMPPIRVVKFLPREMGNFIMLPYEVTVQLGADFDFDKMFFIRPEFYKDVNDKGEVVLTKFQYIDGTDAKSVDKRYKQYLRWLAQFNTENGKDIKPMDKEDFSELSVIQQNNRAARNNKVLDMYMQILSSKEMYEALIRPSGFQLLAELKDKVIGKTHGSQRFFSSRVQRDYKLRNHIGIGLKGQSALHVSGHSYATMLNLNTTKFKEDGSPDTSDVFRFNNTETYSLADLYNTKGELIAEELSSMMAAILDDIKNPILEPLGVNQYTIDVWATIVRAGFGTETAVNLITQPAIKELSKKLQENSYQIKAINQGWNSVDGLLNDYKGRLDAVLSTLPDAAKESLSTELDKLYAKNLNDAAMEFWRNWERKNDLFVKNDIEHDTMLAKYYIFQHRVLYNYGRYDAIAKDLVKINKFLAINKEVGPNIENIIDKKYLLDELLAPTFRINGIESMSNIPGLEAQYNTHVEALKWFGKYFPYDSNQYNIIKRSISAKQGNGLITGLKTEQRELIDGFIRTFADTNFDFFNDINDLETKNRLFKDLPKVISEIKDPRKDADYFDGKLRKNVFIENLKVTVDKTNKVGYITLRGSKLDLQAKNTLIEAIYSLWSNPATKTLITDLIKHSYASTGFFRGLNSFHSLIPLDILSEIGYNKYRKALLHEFNKGNLLFNTDEQDRLIDQMVRNFPKNFTKVFDINMFEKQGEKLYTNDALIKKAKRSSDMFISKDEEGYVYPKYIRVYDAEAKRSLIYKQTDKGIYSYVSNLGKSGNMIEINTLNNIDFSILKDNNAKSAKKTSSEELMDKPEESNDERQDEVFNSDYIPDVETIDLENLISTQKADDIFGDISEPSKDDFNNLPDEIEPC